MAVSSVNLRLYLSEVYNFLQSVTIKFSPIATMMNIEAMKQKCDINENDPSTWKYYVNLSGNYYQTDTMMTVNSLDNSKVINFTTSELALNSRTQANYIPGTTYYENLCTNYPSQTDLIKNIVYPITDIEAAIAAPDFTILGYDTENFLEEWERDYIISQLQQTLDYIRYKKYPQWLSGERSETGFYNPYFYITYWGQLWHRLCECIFTARFQAIKTVNVHSFHIWQYLQSRGIPNFNDIMSREMQLFLYRNENYLYWNRGKQSSLKILNDNILIPLGVEISGKDVYQQTLTGEKEYILTPDLVAVSVDSQNKNIGDILPAESVSSINAQLVSAGDEILTSQEHINAVTSKLISTTLNTYPTKILQLSPQARDRKYADFFNNFLLDTLVTFINEGHYTPEIIVMGPLGDNTIFLDGKSSLVLLYYCLMRVAYQTPVNVPIYYSSNVAYRFRPNTPPTTFYSFNMMGYMNNYVDMESWMSDSTYSAIIIQPDDFSNQLSAHFLKALFRIIQSRDTADKVTLDAMHTLVPYIFNTDTVNLNLTDCTSYEEWFAQNPAIIQKVISPIENSDDPQSLYNQMTTNIFTALVPITSVMKEYGEFSLTNNLYERLKDLFISLCSYNVNFIGTARSIYQWKPITFYAAAVIFQGLKSVINHCIGPYYDCQNTANSALDLEILSHPPTLINEVSSSLDLETDVNLNFEKEVVSQEVPLDISVHSTQQNVSITQTLSFSVGISLSPNS